MLLTSQPAPSWLNRAASIGVALPCVVPKEWIAPPDADTADGELIDEEDDERAAMLSSEQRRRQRERLERDSEEGRFAADGNLDWDTEIGGRASTGSAGRSRSNHGKGKGCVREESGILKDAGGRPLPLGERAPVRR